MNFFGHAAIARWEGGDATFVLGAMLPDLTSIARARFRDVDAGAAELARGVALHHATDAVFHSAPVFVDLCTRGASDLEALGVGHAPARAVAHVGIELLLDGTLVEDRATCDAYVGAIDVAARHEVLGAIRWRTADGAQRFAFVRERLASYGVPIDLRDPDVVADRLERILAPRPRLALGPGDRDRVGRWLHRVRAEVEEAAGPLIDRVRTALRSPGPPLEGLDM